MRHLDKTFLYSVFLMELFHLFILLLFFLGLHPWHMEVLRLGLELELQLLVYATATATWDPSCVYDPHHSSQQHWTSDPLSEARIKPVFSWILVRFIGAAPQWEVPLELLFKLKNKKPKWR